MTTYAVTYRTPTGRTQVQQVGAATADDARARAVAITGCDFDQITATDQLETVPTSALAEGDTLHLHGCVMQLGPIKEGPDTTNKGQFGLVRWSRATVIDQHTRTIPASYFDHDERGNRFWQVQGNDNAQWQRITRPEATQ